MHPRTCLTPLVAALFAACSASKADLDTRTFRLKYLDAEDAIQIVRTHVYSGRPNASGRFSYPPNAPGGNSVLIVSETRDNLDKIARVLAQFDRPPMVRLTFRVIAANGAGAAEPAIADVEATLRKLFRFKGYRLAAEGIAHGLAGSTVEQVLMGATDSYVLTAHIHDVRGSGDSATVALDVNFSPRRQFGALKADVRLAVGETAVLGNAAPAPGQGALILTVRPDLVTASP
jgi:hypothetical protein